MNQTFASIGILGTGFYVPEKVMTNGDFVKMGLDTSDEWIQTRTGISERRIAAENQATSDLAKHAAEMALNNAKVSPQDIQMVIVATSTPDYLGFPSTACILQEKLGIPTVAAFDVSAACSGFNYALSVALQCCKTGMAKNALVVGADCLSKIVNWDDRGTCILFGDGAGAVVIGEVASGYGILSADLHANGAEAEQLYVPEGGSLTPLTPDAVAANANTISMNGKAVFKLAVSVIAPSVEKAAVSAGISVSDIDYFIPHQANFRIIDAARQKLGFSDEQVIKNVHKYGNTSAASIPIALAELAASGRVKPGDILALTGFGAGFTWGTNIVKWKGTNE